MLSLGFVASDTQPDTPAQGSCGIEAMIDQYNRQESEETSDFGRDDVHYFRYIISGLWT